MAPLPNTGRTRIHASRPPPIHTHCAPGPHLLAQAGPAPAQPRPGQPRQVSGSGSGSVCVCGRVHQPHVQGHVRPGYADEAAAHR